MVGSWCCRRPVVHQRTSILSEFNCNLLDLIQLEATPMHSENFAKNASISTGWQEPYTWVLSAYRCGEKPLSSISDIRSAVYKMNNRGSKTDPWGTPHVRWTIDDLRSPRYTLCSTKQIRLKPPVNCVVDAESNSQTLKQILMVNCVECCW